MQRRLEGICWREVLNIEACMRVWCRVEQINKDFWEGQKFS